MDIEIVPCSAGHLEQLIEGADAFQQAYELQPIDGYMPFNGALEYILNQMKLYNFGILGGHICSFFVQIEQ
jgi:[ribosomal protein S5]-alanine N-acetyltransferase